MNSPSPARGGQGGGSISPIIPGSSMAEQEAVNFKVVGSSPTQGAQIRYYNQIFKLCRWYLGPWI